MRMIIEPSLPCGRITAPPSKSEAHRLLICAGLAGGESIIDNISQSEDIKATLGCLEALGCSVSVSGNKVGICGADILSSSGKRILDCNESGSTLRFFIPLCLLSDTKTILTGSERLLSRPLGVYEEICFERKLDFSVSSDGVKLCGKLGAGEFSVRGDVSSQFISGLMLALPLADSDSIIRVIPPFESRPYVMMTAEAMKKFGVGVGFADENTIMIKGRQKYVPVSASVSGDWSNAAFLCAFKESGADIEISGTDENSLQGDRVCVEYFGKLKDGFCDIDLADCPDLAPILFAFAAKHHGGRFTSVQRLRLKESDRIDCMKTELEKFGVCMVIGDNDAVINTSGLSAPSEAVNGHNDHRIVMAMSYLLAFTGGELDGYEAVRKSYPDYFEIMKNAGMRIRYEA